MNKWALGTSFKSVKKAKQGTGQRVALGVGTLSQTGGRESSGASEPGHSGKEQELAVQTT